MLCHLQFDGFFVYSMSQTRVKIIEYPVNVLQNLPQVMLFSVPNWKCVQEMQFFRFRIYNGMINIRLENNCLKEIN